VFRNEEILFPETILANCRYVVLACHVCGVTGVRVLSFPKAREGKTNAALRISGVYKQK
jgi:hypothetical protein